jgi:polygalacturonase
MQRTVTMARETKRRIELGRRAAVLGGLALLCRPHLARGWSGVVEARALGARGDGVADDTAALNAAVEAMAPGGGTLRLAPGRYRLTRPLVLRSGITLLGEDATLFCDDGWVIPPAPHLVSFRSLVSNRGWAAERIEDADIAVRGVGFAYEGRQRGDAHALGLRQVRGILVAGCRFRGGGNGTALLACRDSVVEDCTSTGTLNCAYDHWEGTSDGVVRRCHAVCATGYGILFTGQGTAGDNHQHAARLLAHGNVIEGASTAGIWVCSLSQGSQVTDVVLEGNTVHGGGTTPNGIGASGAVHRIAMRSNTITGIKGGSPLFSRPDRWNRPSGIEMTGNIIRDCQPSANTLALVQALGDEVRVTGTRATGGQHRSLVWVDGTGVRLADNRGDGLTSRFKYNAAAARAPVIADP